MTAHQIARLEFLRQQRLTWFNSGPSAEAKEFWDLMTGCDHLWPDGRPTAVSRLSDQLGQCQICQGYTYTTRRP